MGGLDGYELVATYRYEDESGSLLYERGCFHAPGPPRRRRRFRERRNAGEPWSEAQEFLIGAVQRVPYRLPELVACPDAGERVFLCEGEKDVDRLRSLGLVATTTFAQPGVWSDAYAPLFAGIDVVMLPDNDSQGRSYADLLQKVLTPVARSLVVLELPGLSEAEDVSDWLHRGARSRRCPPELKLRSRSPTGRRNLISRPGRTDARAQSPVLDRRRSPRPARADCAEGP